MTRQFLAGNVLACDYNHKRGTLIISTESLETVQLSVDQDFLDTMVIFGDDLGINSVCFNPQGTRILIAANNYSIIEFSTKNGTCLKIWTAKYIPTFATYSPSGHTFHFVCNDRIHVIESQSGKVKMVLKGH